jgi:hypothetical protein
MTVLYNKQSTTIEKGMVDGKPFHTMGGRIKFIGLPCKPDGSVNLVSQYLTFRGCLGGDSWFNILDYSGRVLRISTRVDANVAHIANYLDVSKAMLPIDGSQFEGVQFIIPVLERNENEAKTLEFWCAPGS